MRSWAVTEIEALIKAMAARRGGFRVSTETAPLILEALRVYLREGPVAPLDGFTIDLWTADNGRIDERLALVRNIIIARATYAAALEQKGTRPITLRRGIQVLATNFEREGR